MGRRGHAQKAQLVRGVYSSCWSLFCGCMFDDHFVAVDGSYCSLFKCTFPGLSVVCVPAWHYIACMIHIALRPDKARLSYQSAKIRVTYLRHTSGIH